MIYFVRHGETDWNIDYRCQGRIDIELNATGLAQSKECAKKLKDVKFDRYFCSPLNRAKQTFQEICGRFPHEYEVDNRLIERDFGGLEGLKRSEFDFDSFWNINLRIYAEGAELLYDFEKRVREFYDYINNNYTGKNILVVSHGGIAFVLLSYYYGIPADGNYSHHRLKNCECAILDNS